MTAVTRDFTVATFVVHEGKVLLLWHRKLGMWLPPGGHIEPNELPDEAAVREVREEAGLEVRLISPPALPPIPGPRQLARPEGVQLEQTRRPRAHRPHLTSPARRTPGPSGSRPTTRWTGGLVRPRGPGPDSADRRGTGLGPEGPGGSRERE